MKQPMAGAHYQDFVIGAPTTLLRLAKPFFWLGGRLGKHPTPYYGTTVRRVGKSKIEVTFDLPPTIKQQMHKAIQAGKQIRLLVL